MKLTRVATSYYAHAYAMQDAVSKVDELRKKDRRGQGQGQAAEPGRHGHGESILRTGSQARERFARISQGDTGSRRLAVIRKHEPEFFAHQQQMMTRPWGP